MLANLSLGVIGSFPGFGVAGPWSCLTLVICELGVGRFLFFQSVLLVLLSVVLEVLALGACSSKFFDLPLGESIVNLLTLELPGFEVVRRWSSEDPPSHFPSRCRLLLQAL